MKYILIILTLFVFTGCAGLWESVSIGKLHGKADESGLNYEDTGVIADPYFLYKNRKVIKQSAIYPNSACRDAHRNAELLQTEEN